jgi:hypothetical protein
MQRSDTPAGFTIRPYRGGDEVQINQRFNEVFKQSRGIAEWHRKFENFGEPPRIMVAEDRDGMIVSQYSATVVPFQIGKRRLLAGQPVDIFAIRRRDVVLSRVFLHTAHAFFETFGGPGGLSMIYGFPGWRHLKLGQLKMIYDQASPVLVWSRPIRERPAGNPSRQFGNKGAARQIEAFWKRTLALHPAAARRDGAWLDNRYFRGNADRYRFVSYTKGGLLEAWAVFCIQGQTASIAELMWDGRDLNALAAVIDRIELEAGMLKSTSMQAWSPAWTHIADGLGKLEWTSVDHPHGAWLGLVSFDKATDEAWLLKNLFYSMGDSDLV